MSDAAGGAEDVRHLHLPTSTHSQQLDSVRRLQYILDEVAADYHFAPVKSLKTSDTTKGTAAQPSGIKVSDVVGGAEDVGHLPLPTST